MAELLLPEARRCTYFFLYDGSKVRGEGDATREGICYFYPEETPVDRQELLCGQLAGVGRCVSELSFSAVRVLRLHRNKFSIRMKDDFFWALGCSVDVPTVSVCELLDQLISLFCFYHGSVRLSYQRNPPEVLAARWARYLSHLQSGSSELQHVFSCLRTIDSTNVDPLLLLKAALILQACQRCPLVLAGCILFRGRVVSTQMFPELTMKVMVYESETYTKVQRPNGPGSSSPFGGAVSSTTVFLTPAELQYLQSSPAHKDLSPLPSPHADLLPVKTRLSRTLSDSEPSDPGSSQSPIRTSFSPDSVFETPSSPAPPPPPPPQTPQTPQAPPPPPLSNGKLSQEEDESFYHSFLSAGTEGEEEEETCALNGEGGASGSSGGGGEGGGASSLEELLPMTLYMHRVKGLVLALLVEPHFLKDTTSMEEVYHSSLASLNGLEAHLRTVSPAAPAAPGPYVFAHFDCVQSTLTTNLSGGPGVAPERPFIRAASLLHSHFCSAETLQEAIIRSAGAAVYGTRSVAQETYFQQHGTSLRNSGIPNHQDSAFSLPSKARHRLLKHGVNLL